MNNKPPIKPPYSPTSNEASAVVRFDDRDKRRVPAPSFKLSVTDNGSVKPEIDHPDPVTAWKLFAQSLNVTDEDFLFGFADQIVESGSQREAVNAGNINYALGMIRGIEPRDTLENMLALQMAATHNLVMTMAKRLGQAKTIQQQDAVEKAFNKLARTFTAQVDCLKKYRSTGEQVVTVQHVNVNDGGQAVIGQVSVGGGVNKKTEETPCKAN